MLAFLTTPLFKYLMIALVVAGAIFAVYRKGEQHVQAEWDLDKARVAAEIERLKVEAGKITIQVETKYVDRIKTVEVKGDTITSYVDRFITPNEIAKCVIPNNFILLHDSAVKNIVPDTGVPTK